MTTRWFVWPSLVAGLLLLVVPGSAAQAPKTAKEIAAAPKSPRAAVGAVDDLAAKIAFRFEILDVVTNHQFAGQKNSFHVEYEYAGVLQGAGFDPKGHAVPSTTYPYFQSVRDTMMDYIAQYADKDDFYEVFGMNICRRVMREFPQIQKITLRIDTPAHGPVNVERGETIVVERKSPRK
jgi:hypothetical protein